MLTRQIIISLILIVSIHGKTNSQDLEYSITVLDSIKAQNTSTLKSISTSLNPTKKDVYLGDGWQHGMLVTDSQKSIFFNGRINVTRGYLECKVENRLRRISSEKIRLIELDNKRYIPIDGSSIEGGGYNSYFEVLSLGSINLFKGFSIENKYQSSSNTLFPKVTGQESQEIKPMLFYSSDQGFYKVLKTNRRTIINLLSSRRNRIEEFVEINKLKFSSERDITTIFNFYNSIE